MLNISIWPTDRTLSGATNPGLSGTGNEDNEAVLHIPQNFGINEASPSDYLASEHHLREGLIPQEKCSQCICQPQLTGLAPE